MRVLVTGAEGFCGPHVVRILRGAGHEVVGVDRGHVDLVDPTAALRCLEESTPAWIVHLAGSSRGGHAALMDANLRTTLNVLDAALRVAPRARILCMGSAAVYGHDGARLSEDDHCTPRGPYGVSKYAMELSSLDYHRQFGLDVVVARLFNAVGPGIPPSLVVGAILSRAREAHRAGGSSVPVGNVDTVRDFVHVDDVALGILRGLEAAPSGQCFNLCSGVGVRVGDILQRLLEVGPRPLALVVDPELVRPADVQVAVGDPRRAEAFGFRATTSVIDSLQSLWT